jgi:hypothetical protein
MTTPPPPISMTKLLRLERLRENLQAGNFDAKFLAEHCFSSTTGQKVWLNEPTALAELEARIAAERAAQ